MTHKEIIQAAEIYLTDVEPSGLMEGDYEAYHVINAFVAGFKLALSQGETYETRVVENGISRYKVVQHSVESFQPDEEVIIQIRKNDTRRNSQESL